MRENFDTHQYTPERKEWMANNIFECECGVRVLRKDKDEHLNSFIHDLRVKLESEVKRVGNLLEWVEPRFPPDWEKTG